MLTHEPLRRFSGTSKNHDRAIRTVCQECTVGCGLLAYVKDERIVDIQGDETHPISRGRLCAKGMAFVQGVTHPDRITLPATRDGLKGPFEAVDNWEKGLDLLAERLRKTKDRHGPESLVVGCDPEAGLDFFLGALRFAKLWGTPHVYHPLGEPKDLMPPDDLIDPWASCSSWLESRCIFLMEADLATTHPVAFGWVLDAQQRGARVLAVDTRFTTTLSKADMAIVIRPESGNLLGLVLMKMLMEEGFCTQESVKNRVLEPKAWLTSFSEMSLDNVEEKIGLAAENLLPMARFLAGNKSLTLVTGKRLAFFPHHGIWSTMARAMGWADNIGGGWYPLESGWPRLNTSGDISSAEDKFPAVKKTSLAPYQFNTDWAEVSGEMEPKALICTGNCLNDFFSPFQPRVNEMDLIAYFGSYPNLTRRMAHMVFPAAVWAERDGLSFTNDRTIQWGNRIVWPSDACRSGLGFWIRLAQRFGWEEYFPWKKENGLADHRAFYNWILERSPETSGCQVDQLQDTSKLLRWPVQDKEAPRKITPMHAPASIEITIGPDEADRFPLHFQATRVISRTNDVVHWWPWTRELITENAVQIHPETAEVLGIENGERILVTGAATMMEGHAWISRMVPRWMVWSPRKMEEKRVVIHKRDQTSEEAFDILKAFLP
ncbi:MAG: molybdopterin-dependent oxidoreductase [Deltaproteobacteria bacterium]|nr:molybdopterin-dependent oxidoreductase [Deltaproteobacteria bacterium]